MAVLVKHVNETPPPVSKLTELEVPPALEDVLAACLAKNPDDRPRTASELSDRLAEVERTLEPWTSARAERWWASHAPPRT